jgi:hypothetical protein
MQTIGEWIGTLPEPHRSRALRNCAVAPDTACDSLGEAVKGHAFWYATQQGHAYWYRVWRGDYTAEPATPDAVRDCVGCAHLDAPVCLEPCATCAMYASRPHWKARAQAEGGGE